MLIENNAESMKDRLEQLEEIIGVCEHLIADESASNHRQFFSNGCNEKKCSLLIASTLNSN